jgi:hypothetical protein
MPTSHSHIYVHRLCVLLYTEVGLVQGAEQRGVLGPHAHGGLAPHHTHLVQYVPYNSFTLTGQSYENFFPLLS